MSNEQRGISFIHHGDESPMMRDIHALTPPISRSSNRSSSQSMASSSSSSENFTTISREFNALVLAGSRIRSENHSGPSNYLGRIGEDRNSNEETNPLAIVLDTNPLRSPPRAAGGGGGGVSIQRVKKEEAESKISAWQNGKIAKINNRLKRDEVVISGWEGKQVHKANSGMKKIERKLEERRAKAVEMTENEIAKARRKAEERRASAEAKRGTKVARVLEIANFMRAMGRAPSNRLRSFF